MSTWAKFAEAMTRSLSKLQGQGWERIKELLTPESIAMMVAFTTAYVISQTTPVGWLADILVAGLIVATVLMVGQEAIEIVKLLIEFSKKASGAKSEKDLDEAAELFAKAVSNLGIDIFIAILFHMAGKAANLKPPGPRSPGLIEVMQKGGGKIMTTVLEPAKGGVRVTPDGQRIWVPKEPQHNTLMMEGQGNLGGAGKSSGVSGSGKTPTGKGQAPEPPLQKLPGKNLAAAVAAAKKKPPSPSQLIADAKKVFTGEDPTVSPDKVKERGESIKEIFEESQGKASKDAKASDNEGMRKSDTPGGKPQPRQFLRGNFAHRFAEYILGRNRLPRPNEAEVVVELRDGTGDIIRTDRIIRNADEGLLLEIKPSGRSAMKGRAQLPERLEALQREFPKRNGWSGQVVEYTRADVEAWLRAENVPPDNIPGLLTFLGF